MVKNLPAYVGDTDSIPDQGRSCMLWSNKAPGPKLLCSHAAIAKAHEPRTCALWQEKPLQCKAHIELQ